MLRAMDSLLVDGRRYHLRRAQEDDVAGLVALLADDPLGATREGADLAPYLAAFREVDDDPNQVLLAVTDEHDALVATMQLTFIPGLSRGGVKRLQIEGVRVGASARGGGLGAALMAWAHEHGRSRGAGMAQLTSDKTRDGAHRFYDKLGYVNSHEGFKHVL